MKKQFLLTCIAALLMVSSTFSQQINLVNPTMTPVQAVEDVLLGAGINAFNITYNGSAVNANTAQQSVRQFNNGTSNFPISQGVLLNTNSAPAVTDADLQAITTSNPTNGVVIEFDFVPSGDTLSFNYVFASAEYTSFTCSNYNDVFGFFISGPGINGPYSNNAINIATVPNSANIPVGINTVNNGTNADISGNCAAADPNWQANNVYFTTSYTAAFANIPSSPSYNGSTVVLPANSGLTCGDTFHIKMAISNVSDTGFDSGVFLEANSFSSGGVDISIETNTAASDSLLFEGCTEGTVHFTRPPNQTSDTLIIYFDVTGTATQGTDFPNLAPGDSVVFYPGQDSIVLTINPINDNTFEGPESVIISAYSVTACGDTVYSEGIIWIDDEPYSTVTSIDTTLLCANDSVPLWATTEGGFPPYTYSWSNGETGANTFGSVWDNGMTEFIVTSTDACGFEYVDTARVQLNQTLKIDSLVQYPANCGMADGAVVGYGHQPGYTGTPVFTWQGPGANNPSQVSASAWPNKPSGWYYFTITDDVCSVTDSIFLEQNPPPTASFDADPEMGAAPLDVTFTNTSDPASSYEWDFGNGQTASVNDLSTQYSTYLEEGTYTVTLTTVEGACTDQASKVITVLLPLNYDMPNGFTPNGDNQNDYFTINAQNAMALEIVILNRWGNVVFESSDVDFKWNGNVDNGDVECADGVYFYKFKLTNSSGEEIEEHGFVHLFRGEKK
nr:choice-of-anchor L domain-containing protein [uncultured Brumimicrobium sp.]